MSIVDRFLSNPCELEAKRLLAHNYRLLKLVGGVSVPCTPAEVCGSARAVKTYVFINDKAIVDGVLVY